MIEISRIATNQMTARASYDEGKVLLRQLFQDQAQGGLFQLEPETRRVFDAAVGDTIDKVFMVVKYKDQDTKTMPEFGDNPLEGTGVTIQDVSVKRVAYENRFKKQITTQQTIRASTDSARIAKEKEEELRLLAIAEGEKDKEKLRITKEKERISAVAEASKTAERDSVNSRGKAIRDSIDAAAKLVVARTKAAEAEQYALEVERKSIADADAARREIQANNALETRLKALVKIAELNAAAVAKRNVPNTVVGGGSNGEGGYNDDAVTRFLDMKTAAAAQQVGVNLDLNGGKKKE